MRIYHGGDSDVNGMVKLKGILEEFRYKCVDWDFATRVLGFWWAALN